MSNHSADPISCKPGHVFHLSKVWGSRHGGSFYSRALVDELIKKGWKVTLLAEQFADAAKSPERVRLAALFRRGLRVCPRKAAEILNLWKLVAHTARGLVIVQGDLPRVTYLFLQLWVPLIYIRQDGILNCPGNNRFLRRSRSLCRRPFGLSCLRVHRKEDCMGTVSFLRQVGRLAFRLRDRFLLHGLRCFVANSRYIAQVHGQPERVLYPPRSSGSKCGFPSKRDLRRLVFCGRLEWAKGAEDAIRILSRLPGEFCLEVLGNGPERGRLENLVEDLHLGQRVKFDGWVDRVIRDNTLASAGTFLMTSLCDEAFGMAGIEALAQGTPVVAYDVGGVSEWCRGEAGVLVPCGDVRRAAEAVREVTQDTAHWAIRSRAARQLAEKEFPVERFGRELDELLKEVMRR